MMKTIIDEDPALQEYVITEKKFMELFWKYFEFNDELIDGLQLDVFPNPASHFLKLESKQFELKDLSYSLLDINGRIHLMGELHERSTTVNLQLLPVAIYILRVTDGSEIIKTFKIIKL